MNTNFRLAKEQSEFVYKHECSPFDEVANMIETYDLSKKRIIRPGNEYHMSKLWNQKNICDYVIIEKILRENLERYNHPESFRYYRQYLRAQEEITASKKEWEKIKNKKQHMEELYTEFPKKSFNSTSETIISGAKIYYDGEKYYVHSKHPYFKSYGGLLCVSKNPIEKKVTRGGHASAHTLGSIVEIQL